MPAARTSTPVRKTASAKAPVVAKAAPAPARAPARTEAKPAAKEKTKAKDKPVKDKKPKLVRDSFTIPKTEYAVLEALKQRAAKAGAPSKKSEVLRAGIKALAALPDGAFLAAMSAVPSLKTGRPAKA